MDDYPRVTVPRKTGVRKVEDVGTALGVSVLATIPVMLTAAERRRRRRGWAVVAMSVPCLAALAWLTFR